LLYSAILRPLDGRHLLLPLAVPLAVSEAVEEVSNAAGLDHRCQLKWPNDVWLDGRKLAGILIEARPPDWAVIGVGVNVSIDAREFPRDLRWPATSIGALAQPDQVRVALDASLGRWVDAPAEDVLTEFRARDALRGRRIRWQGEGSTPGTGTAAGIDQRGNLLVEVETGEKVSLGSGEVQLEIAD
jgi:BirA family biotin operon repressor/biotin-[acetyl-CoA-carboxylase] ligase